MTQLYGRLDYRLSGETGIRTSVYPANQNSDHRVPKWLTGECIWPVQRPWSPADTNLTVLPVIGAEGPPLTFIAAQLVSARIFFNRCRRVGSLSVVLSALRCPTA